MNCKSLFFAIFFIGQLCTISAQHYAISKGSSIISGSGSIMNQGGALFEDILDNRVTIVSFSPTFNHFLGNNLFIGGGLELTSKTQGENTSNTLGIGPQFGYAFGGPENTVFPFVDLGIRYYKMSDEDSHQISGYDRFFGFGVIFPVRAHIGVIIEGGYHILDQKMTDYKSGGRGDIVSLGIGIAGLIFKDPE